MINFTQSCLGVLVAIGSPVLQAGSEAGISRETMAECSGVFRVLTARNKYDVKQETGTATIQNEDYSRLHVQGCVVVALGDYPVDGVDLPPVQVARNHFLANGWQENINYLADGAGSGQNAYMKEADDSRGTLCITQWGSDADLDSPSSFQSLRVTCIDNNEHINTGI